MEKLKCSSCGGELEVEENKEYAKCKYCGARYKLNEDLNINIKLDDNMKELLDNGSRTLKYTSKAAFITEIIIIFIVVGIIIAIVSMYKPKTNNITDNSIDNYEEKILNIIEKGQEQAEKELKTIEEDSDKDIFNLPFENESGTLNAFFLKNIFDKIVRSNKTNDRKISLVFNGTETAEESEIINIKQSLDGDYEVSINYDDKGYVNKVIVEKIN